MEAMVLLTNKYAEGFPNKRYYGGCEVVDKVEQLAIIEQKNSLVLIMPMYNHTLDHRLTLLYT